MMIGLNLTIQTFRRFLPDTRKLFTIGNIDYFLYYISGVTSLRAMLAREKDEDAPRLLTLLCEAFVAVYTSMLCYSMAACDSHVLYR